MTFEQAEIVRDGTEVLLQPSGIRLNHSFKNRGKFVDPDTMAKEFDAESRKFDHLAAKTRAIVTGSAPTAYIRYNPLREQMDDQTAIAELATFLTSKNANSHLYWVRNSGSESTVVQSPLLTIVDIDENPARSTSYFGGTFLTTDDVCWKAFFDTLKFDVDGRRLADGEPVLHRNGPTWIDAES